MDGIIISKIVLISVCILIIFLCTIIYILSAQLMDRSEFESEPIYVEEDEVPHKSVTIEDNLIITGNLDLKDNVTLINHVIPETFVTSESIDKEINEKDIPIGDQLTAFKKK
jgi:hypothetical protein